MLLFNSVEECYKMKISHLKADEIQPSNWSKGKTSEYYIYPENCDYQNKDFLFRVSSATIDESPARFTIFIGYTRYLAMLDSDLDISINRHRDTHEINEIIKFQSENDVISYSTGKDFNLMLKEDIKEHTVELTHGFFSIKNSFTIVFAINPCEVFIKNDSHPLNKNDCLVIETLDKEEYELISADNIFLAQFDLAHDGIF